MKTHPHDEALRQLLRRNWTVAPQADPGFRVSVWARIDSARRMPATWSGWLKLNFARVSYCAAASIVFAGTGGGLVAATQANREREQLIQRYVVSIDPHQQVNSGH